MRMREDFEKWADANWMIVHSQDDAWECWQAATIQAAERIKEEAAKACESDESGRDANGYYANEIRAIDVNKLFGE